MGQGCWRVGGPERRDLWIAANELPLDEQLLPFLQVRTGRPRLALLHWMLQRGLRPVWLKRWMEAFQMNTRHLQKEEQELEALYDEEGLPLASPQQILEHYVRLVPGLDAALLECTREEGREEGREEELGRLFARRLKRPLTAAEHARLGVRLRSPGGVEEAESILLDSDQEDAARWLGAAER